MILLHATNESNYRKNARCLLAAPNARYTNADYFVKARMTFAEICRKKIDPMNESDRTSTMKGSLPSRKTEYVRWIGETLE